MTLYTPKFIHEMLKSSPPKNLRLDRLLVMRAVGSRKEVQRLIRRGRVSHNDTVLKDSTMKVSSTIHLRIDEQDCLPTPLLLVFHKPFGMLCTVKDPWGRLGLDQALPESVRTLFHPVGRLDADTSGLLLFSSNGQVTQRLLHPKYATPRTYWALIEAYPIDLPVRLQQGVSTSLGSFKGNISAYIHRETEESWSDCIQRYQQDLESTQRLDEHTTSLPNEKINETGVLQCTEDILRSFPLHWLQEQEDPLQTLPSSTQHCIQVTVHEGKNRMVRRMLHNAGASVLVLHRTSFAHIELQDLMAGDIRFLNSAES